MAKRKQTTALAPKSSNGLATVRALFDKASSQLTAALAGQMDTKRFVRTAITAYQNGNEKFQQASPLSLLAACMQAAQLGLSVDPILGEYWLIARFNGKRGEQWITGQMGYKGLVKLARRNPNFRSIKAELVHVGDDFEYQEGERPLHRKQLDAEKRPEVRCAYATVYYKDGSSQTHVSPMYEILEARGRSEAYSKWGSGPWKDHPNAMAMVVPLRALLKTEAIDGGTITQLAREDAQAESEDVIEVQSFEELTGLEPEAEPEAIEAAPSNVQELKPAAQERTDRKPTKREQAALDTARNAIHKLKDEFGFPDNDTIYKVATGRDEPMPKQPGIVECLAIAQLSALCELHSNQSKQPPQTHAEMYAAGAASKRPVDHPFFRDGELTANGKMMAGR